MIYSREELGAEDLGKLKRPATNGHWDISMTKQQHSPCTQSIISGTFLLLFTKDGDGGGGQDVDLLCKTSSGLINTSPTNFLYGGRRALRIRKADQEWKEAKK